MLFDDKIEGRTGKTLEMVGDGVNRSYISKFGNKGGRSLCCKLIDGEFEHFFGKEIKGNVGRFGIKVFCIPVLLQFLPFTIQKKKTFVHTKHEKQNII